MFVLHQSWQEGSQESGMEIELRLPHLPSIGCQGSDYTLQSTSTVRRGVLLPRLVLLPNIIYEHYGSGLGYGLAEGAAQSLFTRA